MNDLLEAPRRLPDEILARSRDYAQDLAAIVMLVVEYEGTLEEAEKAGFGGSFLFYLSMKQLHPKDFAKVVDRRHAAPPPPPAPEPDDDTDALILELAAEEDAKAEIEEVPDTEDYEPARPVRRAGIAERLKGAASVYAEGEPA